ncbi:hypothetical protein RB653_000840 [Dictyostelium firmibasis]|uniref:Uncharacterized protein n=1 Tax=Dictyostelium firmibasis TaxID=79012 RepID=A0AAN7YUP3_9MYCE
MVGPTDIVIQSENNKSLLFTNLISSKINSSCSIMSTTIDSSEVTLASSQTKSTNQINSITLSTSIDTNNNNSNEISCNNSSNINSLSNSLDSLYSPEILSKLSLSSSSPPFSATSPNSTAFINFSTTTMADFNVYYPPPLNIAGDDDFYSNSNSSSGSIGGNSFLSNKRKSPYLYKSEKNPSRCLSCNRVILKYIVGVSNNSGKIYPKSTGYKCNQCNTAICEKCASENNDNNINNDNIPPTNNDSINKSTTTFVSTCKNCMKKGNKKTTSIIVKY